MIPDFPNMKLIELADKQVVDEYSLQFGGYSDFTFSNVWSWDLENKCKISYLNSNLVILFTDYYENKDFLSFIGNTMVVETIQILLAFAKESNISSKLGFMPKAAAIIASAESSLIVTEQRDNFDYIYSTDKISTYAGKLHKNKRGLANKFTRDFPNHRFAIEDYNNPTIQNELRKIFKLKNNSDSDTGESSHLSLEASSFERFLNISCDLDLILTCLYINDVMAGFSLDETFSDNTALSHFCKVNYNYMGIYEFQNKHIAKYLHDRNIHSWNWVEDLGIKNLRKSKMSYRPKKLLRTYSISLV
jgi:hypothetical protein